MFKQLAKLAYKIYTCIYFWTVQGKQYERFTEIPKVIFPPFIDNNVIGRPGIRLVYAWHLGPLIRHTGDIPKTDCVIQ